MAAACNKDNHFVATDAADVVYLFIQASPGCLLTIYPNINSHMCSYGIQYLQQLCHENAYENCTRMQKKVICDLVSWHVFSVQFSDIWEGLLWVQTE